MPNEVMSAPVVSKPWKAIIYFRRERRLNDTLFIPGYTLHFFEWQNQTKEIETVAITGSRFIMAKKRDEKIHAIIYEEKRNFDQRLQFIEMQTEQQNKHIEIFPG